MSFITDNIQATMVIGLSMYSSLVTCSETGHKSIRLRYGAFGRPRRTRLPRGCLLTIIVIITTISIGVETDVDRSLIGPSGLTDASLLGWQLLYILPVAIFTNDFLLSSFWMRTFASKTDRDLRIGVYIAATAVLIIALLVGSTGLIATWSGAYDPNDPDQYGSVALFYLLLQLPAWVIGFVLVMVVSLSTAAFDSFQSAFVSTVSNDAFRNRLNVWWIRGAVVLIIIPIVVLALKAPSVLQIYLISDLISAALIPVLIIGLNDRFYYWRGFEVVIGSLGGLLTVFIFGSIYYDSAEMGGKLLILDGGLYADDWSVFGAFVAAPIGGLLWGSAAFALRVAFKHVKARRSGNASDAFDRPLPAMHTAEESRSSITAAHKGTPVEDVEHHISKKGKFF